MGHGLFAGYRTDGLLFRRGNGSNSPSSPHTGRARLDKKHPAKQDANRVTIGESLCHAEANHHHADGITNSHANTTPSQPDSLSAHAIPPISLFLCDRTLGCGSPP